jgi:amidase
LPQSHVVSHEQSAAAFDPAIPPVLEIDPGDTVRFETDDAVYRRLAAGEPLERIGAQNVNAVSGPVAVRGASPGDALRIEVLDVEIARAWSVWIPLFGLLGARTERIQALPVPVEDGRLRLGDSLTVPLEPMIGCIGVAPASGRASTLKPCFTGGGNMDLRELSPGATLWLPVLTDGALLSVGDLHAAMGQAEPTSVSLEAAGAATLRIDLERGRALGSPRLRVGSDTLCVGLGTAPHDAAQSATDQAFELLVSEHGLTPMEAYAYVSARVGLRLGGPAGANPAATPGVPGFGEVMLAVVPDPDRT